MKGIRPIDTVSRLNVTGIMFSTSVLDMAPLGTGSEMRVLGVGIPCIRGGCCVPFGQRCAANVRAQSAKLPVFMVQSRLSSENPQHRSCPRPGAERQRSQWPRYSARSCHQGQTEQGFTVFLRPHRALFCDLCMLSTSSDEIPFQ